MRHERGNLQTHALASSLFGESSSSFRSTVTVNPPTSSTSSSATARPSGKHKRRGRSVAFCDAVTVEETIHVNDFSDEEFYLYWITQAEQSVMSNMTDITTELLSIGAREDGEHICFRGLEGKTQEAAEEYTEMYIDLVDSVIQEQQYRLQDGSIDHNRIAELYSEWTKPCKDIALQRARVDEDEVQECQGSRKLQSNQERMMIGSNRQS